MSALRAPAGLRGREDLHRPSASRHGFPVISGPFCLSPRVFLKPLTSAPRPQLLLRIRLRDPDLDCRCTPHLHLQPLPALSERSL